MLFQAEASALTAAMMSTKYRGVGVVMGRHSITLCLSFLSLLMLTSVVRLGAQNQFAQKMYAAGFQEFSNQTWQKSIPNHFFQLNEKGVVGILAAPPKETPIPAGKLTDLPGKTKGYIYLPYAPNRFGVPPAAYAVRITSKFTAELIDNNGKVVAQIPAKIQTTLRKVDVPVASLEESVCYYFDNLLVCL